MDDEKRITDPSMGSNELGEETADQTHGIYSGSDLQTRIAALSGRKKRKKNINDDEKVVKKEDGKSEIT